MEEYEKQEEGNGEQKIIGRTKGRGNNVPFREKPLQFKGKWVKVMCPFLRNRKRETQKGKKVEMEIEKVM